MQHFWQGHSNRSPLPVWKFITVGRFCPLPVKVAKDASLKPSLLCESPPTMAVPSPAAALHKSRARGCRSIAPVFPAPSRELLGLYSLAPGWALAVVCIFMLSSKYLITYFFQLAPTGWADSGSFNLQPIRRGEKIMSGHAMPRAVQRQGH